MRKFKLSRFGFSKFPAELKLKNSVICMSYILLYHNANVKPVMIGKKIRYFA